MQNLKKSLILIAALSSMQQTLPMLGTKTNTYSPVINITGAGRYIDLTGTYNSQPNVNQAVLGKDGKHVFTNVVKQYSSKSANLTNLPKHAVLFATIDTVNPKWSDSGKTDSQYKHIKLWGVLSTKTKSNSDNKTTLTKSSKPSLGKNGAGIQQQQTIKGFKKGQTGMYYIAGPKKGTAVLYAKDETPIQYSDVTTASQAHHGTLVRRPKNAPKSSIKFAYYEESEPSSEGGVGKPSKRTILFGVPLAAL